MSFKGFTKFLVAFNVQDATPEMVRQAGKDVDGVLGSGLLPLAKRLEDVGLSARCVMTFSDKIQDRIGKARELGTFNAQFQELYATRGAAEEMVKQAKAEVDAQLQSVFKGTVDAINRLAAAASRQVDKIAEVEEKDWFSGPLRELKEDLLTAQSWDPDRKTREVLIGLEEIARSLLDKAARKTGDSGAVQTAYQQALGARYNVAVKVPKGFTNTHFDKLYKMFAEVPVDHVVHPQLKLVEYSTELGDSIAEFGSATVRMGDFGGAPKDLPYKTKTEGFSISTLHEIGHSVDARHGIMAKCLTNNNCGNWQSHSIDEVAQAVYQAIERGWMGEDPIQTSPQQVIDVVKTTLTKGTAKRPEDFNQNDWAMIAGTLVDCLTIRMDQEPWNSGNPLEFGGRVYLESYANDWWSYLRASRTSANTVRGYQWRAPGEWFADLYAFSWFHKEPIENIDPAAAPFMYTA